MRQRTPEPVQLPNYQCVAFSQVAEAGFEARSIVPRAGSFVGMNVPCIDTRRDKRVTLQIDRLAIIGGL